MKSRLDLKIGRIDALTHSRSLTRVKCFVLPLQGLLRGGISPGAIKN